jgi:putative beta-barrel porin
MINLPGIPAIVNKTKIIVFFILTCSCIATFTAGAQDPTSRFRSMGGGGNKGKDTTLQHRTGLEDSITISFRFMDSSRLRKMDSSIYDFTKRFPVPWNYIYLGNVGNAAHDLIFSGHMQPGWDIGLHAYDVYAYTPEETRFYTTTRPYAELAYMLGSKTEQMIGVTFTQNINQNWNYGFQYRLVNSQGTFNNQNTNHNNYRVHSWYHSNNKRYQSFFILAANKLESSENGGLQDFHYLDSNFFASQKLVPTWLGGLNPDQGGPLNNKFTTATKYSNLTLLFRQQYDIIGKKDSIVTDTTVTQLFYPKFRAEHTIQYKTYSYSFFDDVPDSAYYRALYNVLLPSPYRILYSVPSDTFSKKDYWREMINDFSLYQFPDAKNPQQFFKAGITLENLGGEFDSSSHSFYNLFLHGEYRNKTRNQKWDVEANGKFYLSGLNVADYNAYISLKRYISKQIGFLQVGFENANRTPSYVFNRASSFSYETPPDLGKENTTHIFASLEQPEHHLKLSGSYFLVSNYTYFTNYDEAEQQSTLFNILQISAEKVFSLSKHWKWHISVIFQQKAGPAPVNLPAILTRNQFGYEGNFGFRNLDLAFGLEARYYTGYKADNYSPVTGQFFVQNDTTIKQHLPDISLYVHFRIRSFTAYVRAENLNTAQVGPNGFGFTKYNFVAPNNPYTGLQIHVGIFWSFVN